MRITALAIAVLALGLQATTVSAECSGHGSTWVCDEDCDWPPPNLWTLTFTVETLTPCQNNPSTLCLVETLQSINGGDFYSPAMLRYQATYFNKPMPVGFTSVFSNSYWPTEQRKAGMTRIFIRDSDGIEFKALPQGSSQPKLQTRTRTYWLGLQKVTVDLGGWYVYDPAQVFIVYGRFDETNNWYTSSYCEESYQTNSLGTILAPKMGGLGPVQ